MIFSARTDGRTISGCALFLACNCLTLVLIMIHGDAKASTVQHVLVGVSNIAIFIIVRHFLPEAQDRIIHHGEDDLWVLLYHQASIRAWDQPFQLLSCCLQVADNQKRLLLHKQVNVAPFRENLSKSLLPRLDGSPLWVQDDAWPGRYHCT